MKTHLVLLLARVHGIFQNFKFDIIVWFEYLPSLCFFPFLLHRSVWSKPHPSLLLWLGSSPLKYCLLPECATLNTQNQQGISCPVDIQQPLITTGFWKQLHDGLESCCPAAAPTHAVRWHLHWKEEGNPSICETLVEQTSKISFACSALDLFRAAVGMPRFPCKCSTELTQ